jgi:DNA-binding response OmpR family regulator
MFGLSAADSQEDSRPMISLDDAEDDTQQEPGMRDGPPRVLIVDDDFATRHLLVKELQPLGYVTLTAATGGEAVRAIRTNAPDLVVIDVMLPEIDGFQVCRAIKDSRRFGNTPVVLMSAVIDSGRLTPEVLVRYGVDAYFEKPLNTDKVRHRIRQLLSGRGAVQQARDDSFEKAIGLYKRGEIDAAMDVLRAGLASDPMSAKHHFVLANLLQKRAQLHEAIDEYEATIDLKPDYFPALTRLAYLYYRKGYAAKAIETWQRSLPLCSDTHLRHNIELFMRKLIAEMHGQAQAG